MNEKVLQDPWTRAFIIAKRDAEAEMGRLTEIETLTWTEMFETAYSLDR